MASTVVLDTVVVQFAGLDSIGLISPANLEDDHFIDVFARGKGTFKVHEQNYPLVVRGLVGSRVRIERNGQLMTGFDQTGYLADDLNPRNLHSVRLLHGARSVIYGTGSIGGVLLVEDGAVLFEKQRALSLGYFSNNRQQTYAVNLGDVIGKSGLNFSGLFKRANNFQYADGAEAEHSAFSAGSLSLGYALKTSKLHLEWRGNWHKGDWERPRGFQNNPLELRDLRTRYRIGSDLKLKWHFSKELVFENRLWYGQYDIQQNRTNFASDFNTVNSFENRNYTQRSYGVRSVLSGSITQWNFEVGFDYYRLLFEEKRLEEDLQPTLTQEEKVSRSDAAGGLFGLIEHGLDKHLLLFSVRGDLAKLGSEDQVNTFSKFTFGAMYQYSFRTIVNSSISLSRHFRYPETIESTGVFTGGRGVFYGNADINPETSYNLEWDFYGRRKAFSYEVGLWVSFINNRITETLVNSGSYTYTNLSESRIEGIDCQLTYSVSDLTKEDNLAIELSGSVIRGSVVDGFLGNGEPLIGIPPARANLRLIYKKNIKVLGALSFSIGASQVGNFNRLPKEVVRSIWGVNEAEHYFLLDLGLSLRHQSESSAVVIGTKTTNLLDKAYFPFGTHIMGKGRDLRVFLSIDF
ncbi:TonB-dependent receptor [Reichenbachiella sp.]|uniref:TonB-dependent receptor n=1 Tax=Reichenbachiella sp. TaxID=2184521 RepID=UPI003296DEA3